MEKKGNLTLPGSLEAWGDHPAHQRRFLWLGTLNGLLIGGTLALGAWGIEVYQLAKLPVSRAYSGIILSSVVLLLLCAGIGWVTSRWSKTPLTVLAWGGTAVFTTALIERTPTTMQTVAIWLADGRFWGLPLYPVTTEASLAAYLLSGIFLILAMLLVGIFQELRLLSLGREFLGQKRPSLMAWLRFLLPLALVAGAAIITSSMFPNPFASSLKIVHQTIQVARTYEGDLFTLGLEDGISYAAINGVRDQLDGPYVLSIGTLDQETGTVLVMANFDSGAWIKCRLVYAQLSFCEDASLPYTLGFTHLLTGAPLPDDCAGCLPRLGPELAGWLTVRQSHFAEPLIVTRQAAEGSFVLMRAETANGRYAVECWFSGQPRVQLDRCTEFTGSQT